MSTVAERVAAGAYLDEHDPEWWRPDVERAIDLDTLNLESSNNCVLGQRCPVENADDEYLAYASYLAEIPEDRPFTIDNWAVPLGFQADPHAFKTEYKALTAEWTRVITERRAAS